MAVGKMLEFIIGLVIVVIVFITIGGCVSNYLNPKCDLRAVDKYGEFIELYEKCSNVDKQDVCKCGDYYFEELPGNHEIEIGNYGDKMRISLICNGRRAKSEIYDGNIGVYSEGSFDVVKLDNEYKDRFTVASFMMGEMPNPFVTLVNHNRAVKFQVKQPMKGNEIEIDC